MKCPLEAADGFRCFQGGGNPARVTERECPFRAAIRLDLAGAGTADATARGQGMEQDPTSSLAP